ncbi:transposase [Streptomyces atratus]|uniref:transposase n=1 Tax=Streptomyces atratus TaxID=1893 RepID=UPI00368852D7
MARRWKDLHDEVKEHDTLLGELTKAHAPDSVDAFGIGEDTAAEILVAVDDNPERIRSQAAFAELAGVCPVPASSGKTNRHRLNRGGHRRLNSALYRVVIVRMRFHQPTIDYVARRTRRGQDETEDQRCLERYLAREIYHPLCPHSGGHLISPFPPRSTLGGSGMRPTYFYGLSGAHDTGRGATNRDHLPC